MPVTSVESRHWITAQLLVIAISVAIFVGAVLPSHPGLLGGGFFLAIGTLNISFYKSTGRKFFARTQSSGPFVARFWARNGEKGTQVLFLGIGVILAAAGCVLLIAGAT